MNIEVSVSRTGRGLEMDEFTHRLEARERNGELDCRAVRATFIQQ